MTQHPFSESEILELKKSTSELKEAIISIVAILNKHQKGELYFGIKNNGEVVGQMVSENTIREISKTISDNIEPKIFPKINPITVDGKKCVQVEFIGNNIPYYAYGRAYIRVADEDKQLSAKEIEKIILQNNQEKLRWDLSICQKATPDDIDDQTIKKFIELTQQAKRLTIGSEDKLSILQKLKLATGTKITNAAILLFGKQPASFFDNISIRCGRFRNVIKEEFIDLKDFDGNLFDNFEEVITFLQNHMQLQATIKGIQRQEKWEIPIEALREAIINAFIHRDYTDPGFTYIKIYDHQITITNPGKLPQDLTIADLYKEHESKLRNPLLAQVFYYTGFIDIWGRGILNIVRILQDNNLKEPLIEEGVGAFRIIFTRPLQRTTPQTTPQTTPKKEEQIFILIKENPKITKEELAGKVGITIDGVKYHLKKLKSQGKVKWIGAAKSGYWDIISE